MARPRFNTIYRGEWPYSSSEGVGLEFTGLVNDEQGLIDMMWNGYSCHPVVGKEIIDQLVTNRVRRTTTMSHLNFDQLFIDMKKFGVTMKIIAPHQVKYPDRVLPRVPHDSSKMVR